MSKESKTNKSTGAKTPVGFYGPTDRAKENPRRIRIKKSGRWVGVGGPVFIAANPPDAPFDRTIPEATPEEYECLKHYTKLIKFVEDAKSKKPDPENDQG